MIKQFWQSLNKFYLANFSLATFLVLSIVVMFVVQFKVEALQDEMMRTKIEISAYEDELQLLEVEWVYLTRPERLRNLASRYLKDNSYILASQIKDRKKLEEFYFVNYKRFESEVALNSLEKSKMVSF